MTGGLTKRTEPREGDDQAQWLPVSDLMAGLMMVFLFLSVSMMRYALVERSRIKEIAISYKATQAELYGALTREFETDLVGWEARIDGNTLSFVFEAPEVLFARGSAVLTDRYKRILDDFFPRYMRVLEGYRGKVDEVRIEGHTSSRWNAGTSGDDAYFRNMALSQDRTRTVLDYVYRLPDLSSDRDWMKRSIAAVGMSSSRLIYDEQGREDADRSRRVDFRVITDSDVKITEILED